MAPSIVASWRPYGPAGRGGRGLAADGGQLEHVGEADGLAFPVPPAGLAPRAGVHREGAFLEGDVDLDEARSATVRAHSSFPSVSGRPSEATVNIGRTRWEL